MDRSRSVVNASRLVHSDGGSSSSRGRLSHSGPVIEQINSANKPAVVPQPRDSMSAPSSSAHLVQAQSASSSPDAVLEEQLVSQSLVHAQDLAVLGKQILGLNKEINGYREQISKLMKQAHALTTEKNDLGDSCSRLDNDLQKVSQENAQLREANALFFQQNMYWHQQAQQLYAQVQQLTAQLAAQPQVGQVSEPSSASQSTDPS